MGQIKNSHPYNRTRAQASRYHLNYNSLKSIYPSDVTLILVTWGTRFPYSAEAFRFTARKCYSHRLCCAAHTFPALSVSEYRCYFSWSQRFKNIAYIIPPFSRFVKGGEADFPENHLKNFFKQTKRRESAVFFDAEEYRSFRAQFLRACKKYFSTLVKYLHFLRLCLDFWDIVWYNLSDKCLLDQGW